jgi:hypothetical protein
VAMDALLGKGIRVSRRLRESREVGR